MKTHFVALALSLILSASALAGDVQIAVELNPAGSFKATSSGLAGSARKTADGGYEAQNVVLSLDTLATGIALRDQHMKQKYFDTKKFPKAVLKQAKGKDGKFTGELVIRDVPVKISGEYEEKGDVLNAKFPTKMSDYKIPPASYMGVGAEDEVQVEVNLPIAKK